MRACGRQRSLSFLRVPQLKERLRNRGQPVSGKKVDLIARLLESMACDAPPSPALGDGHDHGSHNVPSSRLGLGGATGDLTSAAPAVAAEDVSGASAAAAGADAAAGAARELRHGAAHAHAATATAGGRSGRLSEGWAAAAAEALIAGDPSSVSLGMPGGGGSDGGGGRDGLAGAQARGAAAAAAPGRPGAVEGEEEARNRRMNGYAAMVNIVSEALDEVGEARAGGVTSSRALGRELARIPSPENPGESALTCLKSRWPSLMAFLKACPSDFTVTDIGKAKEFGVVKNYRDRDRDGDGDRGAWEGGRGGGGGFEESRHAVPRAVSAAVNGGGAFGSHRG